MASTMGRERATRRRASLEFFSVFFTETLFSLAFCEARSDVL